MAVQDRVTTTIPCIQLHLQDIEGYLAGNRDTWISDDAVIEYVDLSTNRLEF